MWSTVRIDWRDPGVFHRVLEPTPVTAWQVIQQPEGLRVLLVPTEAIDTQAVARSIEEALSAVGAGPAAVTVESVEAIPKTKMGKSPLVVALRP